MKKLLFIVLIGTFCLNHHSMLAQPIQVDCSTGNVGIGTSPSGSQKLVVNGGASFSGWTTISGGASISGTAYISNLSGYSMYFSGEYAGLSIDDYGYYKAIYPSLNNTCNLGFPSCAFSQIWSYSGSISLSDKRQKENIKNLENSLGKVLQLQGVHYDLKKEYVFSIL